MNDTAYRKALVRRDELRRELEEIEQFLAVYERFSDAAPDRDVSASMSISMRRPTGTSSRFVAAERSGGKVGPSEVATMAERAIRDAGRPLTRSELAEILISQGVEFSMTEDVPRYLGTVLWRNKDRFKSVPGKGYATPDVMSGDDHRRIIEANAKSAEIAPETREQLRQAVRNVLSTVKLQEHLRNLIVPQYGPIPAEIDRIMLDTAGDELGRALYEPEKIFLRDMFKVAARHNSNA